MDTSLHGFLAGHERLWLYQLIWCLPGSVCGDDRTIDVGDLFRWLVSDIPAVLCRHPFWASARCWVLSSAHIHRLWNANPWNLHHCICNAVLAALPSPGDCSRLGKRNAVHSPGLASLDLLHQEARSSSRPCILWCSHRRHHFPTRKSSATLLERMLTFAVGRTPACPQSRLPVDGAGDGFPRALQLACDSRPHQTAPGQTDQRPFAGSSRFQGQAIHLLLHRHLLCAVGPLLGSDLRETAVPKTLRMPLTASPVDHDLRERGARRIKLDVARSPDDSERVSSPPQLT